MTLTDEQIEKVATDHGFKVLERIATQLRSTGQADVAGRVDFVSRIFRSALSAQPAITEERVIDLKQKYTLSLPVVVQDEPEAHNVYLQVGNQRFCVTPMYCESLEEANHMRTMLANALANLLAAEGKVK